MEGRWAQLTVDAHIARALDYSRPVKPFIENIILDRMELERELEYSVLYPVVDESNGEEILCTKAWIDRIKRKLKPWLNPDKLEEAKQETLLDKIAYLEEQRKKL